MMNLYISLESILDGSLHGILSCCPIHLWFLEHLNPTRLPQKCYLPNLQHGRTDPGGAGIVVCQATTHLFIELHACRVARKGSGAHEIQHTWQHKVATILSLMGFQEWGRLKANLQTKKTACVCIYIYTHLLQGILRLHFKDLVSDGKLKQHETTHGIWSPHNFHACNARFCWSLPRHRDWTAWWGRGILLQAEIWLV